MTTWPACRKDRHFLEIIKAGMHKNQRRNWKMPHLFRSSNTKMPDDQLPKWPAAYSKEETQKEDFQFMCKVIDCGCAVPVPQKKLTSPSDTNEPIRPSADSRQRKQRLRMLPAITLGNLNSSAEFQGMPA